jgi:hypothetical protein
MKFFGRNISISEPARRTLYMAPGIAMILVGIGADACASREKAGMIESRNAQRIPPAFVQAGSQAGMLMKGETTLGVK